MRRLLPLAAASIFAGSATASALELADYVGIWTGKGTYARKTSTESSGKLTCKLTITANGNQVIVVKGRCAAPEGSRGFTTEITDNGDGKLTGRNLAGADMGRNSSGRLGSNGFRLTGQDSQGKLLFQLTSPLSGQIEMHSGTWDGDKYQTADVVLSR